METLKTLKIDFSSPDMPDLDEAQGFPVYSKADNILVIAGPGTGKTRIVHAKIIQVFKEGDSSQATTFQKEAAQVLKQRTGGLGDPRTIHSEGYRRLGKTKYQNFDQMIVPPPCPVVDWSIMDEGQDQARKYYDVFLSLGSKHFLVADSWQHLFGWAGADLSVLDDFIKDLDAEVWSLKTNYRSASSIVELGNRFSSRTMSPREGAPKGSVYIGSKIPDLEGFCILARDRKALRGQSRFLRIKNIPHTLVIYHNGRRHLTNYKDGKSWIAKDSSEYFPTVLMTIHCAKGTEWERVFLLDWDPKTNLELEEYVFYVGMTRAIKELWIASTHPTYFTRRL